MNTQKIISKLESLPSDSQNTAKDNLSSLGTQGKLQEKQKVKRPNYMLRLL